MKPIFLFLLSLLCTVLQAQWKDPVLQAHFGVDAELSSSYLYDLVGPGDDWFSDGTTIPVYNAGTYIIDTNGAAEIAASYAIDPAYRKLPFYRPMRFPSYSILGDKLLIDGVFIRDYHGTDSTVFTNGSKNAMSPADWSMPETQTLSDINDIEDMFMHVRRGGPSSTNDLWLFGGVTIIGTNGDRYFDFEMYQTDISYDRASRKFSNYGPDEGHTSWTFDATGKVLKPGDIIFTAEYSTAGITALQARIWVNKDVLTVTPAAFDWVKDVNENVIYDGATPSSQYVYAAIKPKSGAVFYTGVQSKAGTWAGPFKFIDASNNVHDTYTGGEFIEFSVNLTILGLDPVTWLENSSCNLPFKRVMVKSRNSTSFNSDLTDFVEPYPIFSVPKVDAQAETQVLCSTNDVSKVNVLNPYDYSTYTWSTVDGSINGATDLTSIYATKPGMYIVTQQLMSGCGAYAKDTVTITQDANCTVLDVKEIHLEARFKNGIPLLQWTSEINDKTRYYEVQRSINGKSYQTIYVMTNSGPSVAQQSYSYWDKNLLQETMDVSYRIKAVMYDGEFTSASFLLSLTPSMKLSVYPNPASDNIHVSVSSDKEQSVELCILNTSGYIIYGQSHLVKQGLNVFTLNRSSAWTPGLYIVRVISANNILWEKFIMRNNNP